MNVPNLLAHIEPERVEEHLRHNGWKPLALRSQRGSVWTYRNQLTNEEHQIRLPSKCGTSDYGTRLAGILRTLARIEGRTQLEVLRTIRARRR